MPLTIFLIRKDLKTADEVLENIEALNEVPLPPLPDGGNEPRAPVSLYFEHRRKDFPPWVEFFRDLLEDLSGLPEVSSCPAILLVPVDDRLFAIAFSRGSSLLSADVYDQTFGLKVALNSISPVKMRSYNKRSFDALFRQTREHAARETKLESFGIDAERDLVRQVTGKPKEGTLGSTMSGGASLNVSTKVGPKHLVHYLRRLYRKWTLPLPEEYRWLGCIKDVRESGLKELLDSYLDDRLRRGSSDIWLTMPGATAIDWYATDGFRFVLRNRSRQVYPDITFEHLTEALKNTEPVTVALLRNQKVEMLDDEHNVRKRWKLYSCVNAEVHLDHETYVLSSGVWYKVDSDLLDEIDRVIDALPRVDLGFPDFDICDKGEGGYNIRVANREPEMFCCLDRQEIPFGGGRSKFELCDLLTSAGDVVHVKRGRSADRLSHLFAQGRISAELVMTRESARQAADALIAANQFSLPQGKDFSGKHTRNVIYAIIAESHKLAVFSRINLRNAIRALSGYDWGVQLYFVPESEIVRKRQQQKRRRRN